MLYWESDAKDLVKCSCGNDVMSDGFTPADATTGKEISPDIGSGWDQITWRCERCDAFSMPHLFWDAIGA